MKLYVFRHGVTYFSKNGLNYGEHLKDAKILPEGVPAIEKIAEYLKNIKSDINYTSPYLRCIQTTNIITRITSKKFEVDENLIDFDPQTENRSIVIKRMLTFSKKLESQKPESATVCTHGFPINTLIAYFTKGFVREADLDNFPDPGILITIEDKKAKFNNFN